MRSLSAAVCAASIVALSAVAAPAAGADEGDDLYCAERSLGQWFYCRSPEPEPEDEQTPAAPPPRTDEQLEAEAEEFRQELERARLLATYAPTAERVAHYQQLQWQATERAALFADHWRRNTWSDASLDYTTIRPVAQYAKHEWTDQRREEMTDDLADMSDSYGLFYFYRSDCPYCQRFSPVLRDFADRFGVEVKAVSVDGGPMPDFPNAERDQGQFQRLLEGRQSVVPAVLLLNTETRTPHWITFGLISGEELAERIFVTMSREPGEDF